MILKIIVFLVLNFAALGIGAYLMGNPATNEWYQSVNKAPWTPPGWVFGAAWTLIMLFFAIFMSVLLHEKSPQQRNLFLSVYAIQWILNVAWNPTFFSQQNVLLGGVLILVLTLIIAWFTWKSIHLQPRWNVVFVLPYFIWLCIATSLNWYIYLKN